jgi:hypothetical protein
MKDNIEYSSDWITQEIIKTHFKEKETGKKEVVTISKLDLLITFQKFIKLNQGE